MNLRRQLILVSLLLLALPWAGCQFVREIESTLRQGQAQALQATAQAIAASFADKADLLYPYPERLNAVPDPSHSLYARVAPAPILVDGYADGWPEQWSGRFDHSTADNSIAFNYQAATRNEQLYLLLQVEDSELVYDNPGLSPEPNGDRLLLRTWLDGKRQEYVIATAAPGSVRARYAGRRHPQAQASRIRGYWQDTSQGYTLELEMPLAMTGGRLGLQVINISPSQSGQSLSAGNISTLDQAPPPWLIFSPEPLRRALEPFQNAGRNVSLFDTAGWKIAGFNTEDEVPSRIQQTVSQERPFWLLRLLYRRILTQSDLSILPRAAADGRLQSPELSRALEGQPDVYWYRDSSNTRRTSLSAAAPIEADGRVIGAVLVRQSSEEYLSLTDQAFSRLLAYSLLAIAVAALGLLAYASILSWRIGRLSRAASNVVRKGKIVMDDFPHCRARDEVGELSRRYASLLVELQKYNEYLRTLSRKLSHELRTPLAVIQSSLDNLEHELTSDQSAVYIDRARGGLGRLNRILTAMTEASHVEDSVRGEALAALDLVPLLNEVLPAYQGAYPEQQLSLKLEPEQAWILASADLLVQALDKLIDNAASFCPEDGHIIIGLSASEQHWKLSVSNDGPVLPAAMQRQLFEAMVSMRTSSTSKSGVHLGLGLYIVKLIVDYFGGEVRADNRKDESGVVVQLMLPKSDPPKLIQLGLS